jgi:hypothetical protein
MTASTPSIKTVFGYINQHGANEFPARLATIVESDASFFLVDGYGVSHLLVDKSTGYPDTKERISLRPTFIKETGLFTSTEFSNLTAFGIAANNIVVGTVREVFKAIEREIDLDQHTGESLQRLITAHHEWEKFLETPPTPE